jgi:hypothetical protein
LSPPAPGVSNRASDAAADDDAKCLHRCPKPPNNEVYILPSGGSRLTHHRSTRLRTSLCAHAS